MLVCLILLSPYDSDFIDSVHTYVCVVLRKKATGAAIAVEIISKKDDNFPQNKSLIRRRDLKLIESEISTNIQCLLG